MGDASGAGSFLDAVRYRDNAAGARAYPGRHSCGWSHSKLAPPGEVCLGDPGEALRQTERHDSGDE